MMNLKTILRLSCLSASLLILSVIGCKKDASQGRGVETVYTVNDSLVDPFQTVEYDQYDIRIKTSNSTPNQIEIINYANIEQTNGKKLKVVGQLNGTLLTIPSQVIQGPSDATIDYISVSETAGYFGNDSIYLRIAYSNRFDPNYGYMWGKKK